MVSDFRPHWIRVFLGCPEPIPVTKNAGDRPQSTGVLIIRSPSDIIRPTGYYPVERIISARFQTKRCKVVVVAGKRNSEFTVVEGLHSSNIYGTRQHICVRTTVLIIRRYPLMSQIIRPFPRLSARFPKGLSAQIRWRSG